MLTLTLVILCKNTQVSHMCRDLWGPSYKVGAQPQNCRLLSPDKV